MNTGGHRPLQAVPAQAQDRHYPAQDPPPVLCHGVKAEWQNQTGKLIKMCLVKFLLMLFIHFELWCFS